MTHAITTIQQDLTLSQIGQTFVRSGFFKDSRDAAQAIVKIMAGAEVGLPPVAAMRGISIVEGKIELASHTMAALIRRSGIYDYRVLTEPDDGTRCEIEYYRQYEGKWKAIGRSRYTLEMARQAGLTDKRNWKNHPAAMLYNRAMSQGFRLHCPDLAAGPVYYEGELREELPEHDEQQEKQEIEIQAVEVKEEKPEVQKEPEERQEIIQIILEVEGETFKAVPHKYNARRKHLGEEELADASLEQLQGYLDYLINKTETEAGTEAEKEPDLAFEKIAEQVREILEAPEIGEEERKTGLQALEKMDTTQASWYLNSLRETVQKRKQKEEEEEEA